MAEVSGPGRFSKRTDKAVSEANRSLPNAGYGEQAAYQEQIQGAPLPQMPSQPAPPADVTGMDFNTLFGSPADRVTPFDAESEFPDRPVTYGADAGEGPGTEVLGLGTGDEEQNARLRSYLPALEYLANRPGSSESIRNMVRRMKGVLG